MKPLTSCQENDITTEAKTMRRGTAGFDIKSLTSYQGNMTRVKGTIVRHMDEYDMESLTCCQGNEATGRASTSIRRNRAGQADMKSLTACQGNKNKIGERCETGHNWSGIKCLHPIKLIWPKLKKMLWKKTQLNMTWNVVLTSCWSNMIKVGIDKDYEKRCS